MATTFFSEYDMVLKGNSVVPSIRVGRSEADRIMATSAVRAGFITIQSGAYNGSKVKADSIVAFVGVKGGELPEYVPPPEKVVPDTATCKHPEDKRTIYKKGEPPRYFRVCDVCGYRMGAVHKSTVENPELVQEFPGKE